jgi:exodeoxyribonuclease VII large subunit
MFSDFAEPRVLSISELGDLVKSALNNSFGSEGTWVKGVVASYSANSSGHHYLDLQEFDANSSTSPVATISCVIWKPKASYLLAQLLSTSLGPLRNGLNLVARVKPNYWVKGGRLSFQIEEIDLGLSQIANLQEKEKIREKLRKLNIFDFNRGLEVPILPLRIGLVTAQGSAAESDFIGELRRSGFPFVVTYRPASTAGDAAPGQISRSIGLLQKDPIDLICLVRGGGSMSDLSVFDTEQVVSAVAGSNIPVWVGIGHSTDTTLVEEVANMYLDVPQSVARAVASRVQVFADGVELLSQKIRAAAKEKTEFATMQLSALASKVVIGPRQRIHQHGLSLNQLVERTLGCSKVITEKSRMDLSSLAGLIALNSKHIVSARRRDLDISLDRLRSNSALSITNQSNRIERIESSVTIWDPEHMASRGFSLIAHSSGHLVKEISDLLAGEKILGRLGRGRFTATVNETERVSGVQDGVENK